MGTKENPGKYDCYANAKPDEPVFVLLGRDPVAPFMVALWADLRRQLGLSDEAQVQEASDCGVAMVEWGQGLGKTADHGRVLVLLQRFAAGEAVFSKGRGRL